MAVISPFKAFHYNTHTIRDLSTVITPPYDVIPEGMDKVYRDRSPYNFAHVDLPTRSGDDYAHSADLLRRWHEHSIVTRDQQPSYYLYRQTFKAEEVTHQRDTLMCAVQLCDFAEGVVRPHENTYGQAKADRLQQMRATGCQLSHIFGMVKDPEGFLRFLYEKWEYHTPLLHARAEDGVEHTVWRMHPDPSIAEFFRERPIYIVDGHHRYESSLAYAREQGVLGKPEQPAAYQLFAIANSYDPALVVFPTHRFLRSLPREKPKRAEVEKSFQLTPFTFEELRAFVKHPQPSPQFGLYFDGKLFLCTPRHWQAEENQLGRALCKLSVIWSDQKFLREQCGVDESNRKEHISYEKDLQAAWDRREQSRLIVFHAPPAIDDVTHIADERRFMPQKSTYFYPKLGAGLIMRELVP